MKHLLSTLLLSCTFITVTAMDETNKNRCESPSMNVSEADSLGFEHYKAAQEFKLFNNYWNDMHKGEDQNNLLNEYINYVLRKKASATGKKAKTASEAFVEYQKQNPNLPNIDIYRSFLIDICSLSQTDIANIESSILINNFRSLKEVINDNSTLSNQYSFQDYCKLLETETDNWNLYMQYWMFNNAKKELTPEQGMVLLHEYAEYVLNKEALKTGEKPKKVFEAFEEYKKKRYPDTTTLLNYIAYAQFFKNTCSLTDTDLEFLAIEMSLDYYNHYLKNTAPTDVDSEDSTDVDLPNSTSSDTIKQQQQVTTYKETSAQKQLFINLNTANKRRHDPTMGPQAKNAKRLHDIMQNLDEVFTQIKEKNQPVDIGVSIIDRNGKTRTLPFRFSGEKQPKTEEK